jgi:hypothetical protein
MVAVTRCLISADLATGYAPEADERAASLHPARASVDDIFSLFPRLI